VTPDEATQAKDHAFAALRARDEELAEGIEDRYGMGYHEWKARQAADPEHQRLFAAFREARDVYRRVALGWTDA